MFSMLELRWFGSLIFSAHGAAKSGNCHEIWLTKDWVSESSAFPAGNEARNWPVPVGSLLAQLDTRLRIALSRVLPSGKPLIQAAAAFGSELAHEEATLIAA